MSCDYKNLLSFTTCKFCLTLLVMYESKEWSWNIEEKKILVNHIISLFPTLSLSLMIFLSPSSWSLILLWRYWPAKAVPVRQHANLCHLHMSSAIRFTEWFKRERTRWKLPFIAILFVPSSISIFSKKVPNILGLFQPLLIKTHTKSQIYLVII